MNTVLSVVVGLAVSAPVVAGLVGGLFCGVGVESGDGLHRQSSQGQRMQGPKSQSMRVEIKN